MPNKCKDCKFWEITTENDDTYGPHLGNCSSDKFLKGYDIKAEEVPIDGVLVEDDEGWGFYTSEEFGCIHYKNKT